MYNYPKPTKTTLSYNKSYQGERLEEKINRIVNNNEPIKDGSPRIYTEKKDGVQPAYDIRTDRFEIAIDAMDKVNKTHVAKREARAKTIGETAAENMQKETKTEGGAQPIQGTENQ